MPPAGVDRGCKLPPARGIALCEQPAHDRRPGCAAAVAPPASRARPKTSARRAPPPSSDPRTCQSPTAPRAGPPLRLHPGGQRSVMSSAPCVGRSGAFDCDEKTLAEASHRFHVAVRTGLGKQAHRTRMVPAQIALSRLGHFRRLSSTHGTGSFHDTARPPQAILYLELIEQSRDGGPSPPSAGQRTTLLEAHREADVPPPPEEVVEVFVGVAGRRISRTRRVVRENVITLRFRERALGLDIEQIVDAESQLRHITYGVTHGPVEDVVVIRRLIQRRERTDGRLALDARQIPPA